MLNKISLLLAISAMFVAGWLTGAFLAFLIVGKVKEDPFLLLLMIYGCIAVALVNIRHKKDD
jgi:F0F1-type ATP synthase assembly protein I